MVDYSVFDSTLDAAFIVDGTGKITYCNDAAATFCQSSVRRLTNKAVLSDLMTLEEPGLLPFNEESQGRLSPTAFIETTFHVPKAEKSGKVQVAIRPLEDGQWFFFLRDVSLEEALHSKYRSELSQKEEYARNLEKLVEARTAELQRVNATLNAILNSLGQGFFTFKVDGECGQVYTRACEEVLEGIPAGQSVARVLGIPNPEHEQFRKWTESVFKEYLPFDELKPLGPEVYPHSGGKHIVLEYYPIRSEDNSIAEVVVVATDKTAERKAQIELEQERQYASMIIKYMKNKDQFHQFLHSVKRSCYDLLDLAKSAMEKEAIERSFRILHTLEGEAGTFSILTLRDQSRICQHILEPFRAGGKVVLTEHLKYKASLDELKSVLERFLKDNQNIIRLPMQEDVRTLEVNQEEMEGFLDGLARSPQTASFAESGRELFLKEPIENRIRYYEGLVENVAERLGKKVKPLVIEGGDIRIFPDRYKPIFSSLVHAFRNAVDHGLEEPVEREFAGKDPAGLIRVLLKRVDGKILMTVQDDGRGIDPVSLRERLGQKFPGEDFSALSDDEVLQQVFRPGFSSRDEVGEFSGRGVGLDALRDELVRAGGSIKIESKMGEGTTLKIEIPELTDRSSVLRSA
ncbi:MAG: ATP-binding protein [Bdellovibrionales bacterium]